MHFVLAHFHQKTSVILLKWAADVVAETALNQFVQKLVVDRIFADIHLKVGGTFFLEFFQDFVFT
jgi:hypothetical protein